jgi:hypothetical protein
MSATQIESSTKLGATGPDVFPIALGGMAMSGIYGETSDDESIATIHEAIDRGITFSRASALGRRGSSPRSHCSCRRAPWQPLSGGTHGAA